MLELFKRNVAICLQKESALDDIQSVIILTPKDQLAFWKELQRPTQLTTAQLRLGEIIRGEAVQ